MLPINDLARHAQGMQERLCAAAHRVLGSGWYVLGQECQAFEAEFASFCGVKHCLGVANGTDALEIALRALGVERGSRVATVANAGYYSSTALAAIGAEPVFVEVAPSDHLMDLVHLRRLLQDRAVDAVIVTHLYGLLHDMEAIMEAAREAGGVPVLEDCAQAHGAARGGQRAGSFGDAAAFSFYPTKNLGAAGDGGAIVTNGGTVAARASALRQYGWQSKYRVTQAGGRNSRLDELQAAVLREKLPHLDDWNARRREIAAHYSRTIQHQSVQTPPVRGSEYAAHLYVVRAGRRDALRAHLAAAGVGTDIHYPVPDHLQAVMQDRNMPALRVTEALAEEVLTLPCFAEMTDAEVRHVVSSVNAW